MATPTSLVPPPSSTQPEEEVKVGKESKDVPADPLTVLTEIRSILEKFFKDTEGMKEEMKSMKERIEKIEKATISLIESASNKDDLSGTDPSKAKGEGAEELKIKEEKGPAGGKDSGMVVKGTKTIETTQSLETPAAVKRTAPAVSATATGRRAVVVTDNVGMGDYIIKALKGELSMEHLIELEKKSRRRGINI